MIWPRLSSSTCGSADRGELEQRRLGQRPDALGGHAEHLAELLVALPLLEDELDDRPLLCGELVERGHAGER